MATLASIEELIDLIKSSNTWIVVPVPRITLIHRPGFSMLPGMFAGSLGSPGSIPIRTVSLWVLE